MSALGGFLTVAAALATTSPQGIERYLLQNGEPIVGVYYYPWFHGPPWGHVAFRPAVEYNNISDPDQIRWLLKTVTDYGVNLASFSYWNNKDYLQRLKLTIKQAERLREEGRTLFLSPYLEPPTIDKKFASKEAIEKNAAFISTYLEEVGSSPCFPELGGRKFTNIYVAYYVPTDDPERFRAFLRSRYRKVEALNKAWGTNFKSFEEISPKGIKEGTAAFADLQRFRAEELERGWRETMQKVKGRTGFDVAFTGDCSNSIVGLTRYIRALTGLTWYSFSWEMNAPFCRPKICSEVAKYTGTTFLYTIAPGYIDRQQRWPGCRIERDPFLYECSWANALSTLPDGIMILTHTEWFEGTVIDYTREYGKRQIEATERYSTLFKRCFPGIYAEKRRKKPIAIVYNEWATSRLRKGEGGEAADDLLGTIKVLQTLSVPFDVVPPEYLTEEELSGRAVVVVPCCGERLGEDDRGRDLDELLFDWARKAPGRTVVVTLSRWWASRLGLGPRGAVDLKEVEVLGRAVPDKSSNFLLGKLPERARVIYKFRSGEPYAVSVPVGKGKAVFLNTQFGAEFRRLLGEPLTYEWVNLSRLLEGLLSHFLPLPRRANSYEITAVGPVEAERTAVVFAVNAIPWSYIVEHRPVGGGLGRGHSLESTKRWTMKRVRFEIPLPERDLPVAEVLCLDSGNFFGNWEPRRFVEIKDFEVREGAVSFEWTMKFHAVFCVAQGPVKVGGFGLRVVPGQKGRFEVSVENISDEPVRGRLGMDAMPGLSVKPVSMSLAPGERKVVALPFEASPDYATGERTVVLWFEPESGGGRTLFFRPLKSLVSPKVACLTTFALGPAGGSGSVKLTLANLGEVAAKDVVVKLGDFEARTGAIPPGGRVEVGLRGEFPQKPGEVLGAKVEVRWSSPAGEGRATFPLRLVAVGPEGAKEAAILAANPLLDSPSFWSEVEVSLPKELASRPLIVVDEKGRQYPTEIVEGRARFVCSLGPGEVRRFRLVERHLPVEPVSDLVATAHGLGTGQGLVMVKNSAATFVFDEKFGGFLSWMAPRGDREGFSAVPGGALIVEYDLGKGRKVRLSRRPGRLRLVRRSATRVEVESSAEDEFLRVVDRWTFLPESPVALLSREVKVKRPAKFWDLSVALLRLRDEPFSTFWPNGVGNVIGGKKRCWLETWYVEDGYLALGRMGRETAEAGSGPVCGLVVLDKGPIFRVRYGFFDGEAQIRLRARKVYRGGEEVRLRLALVCGRDLGWRWAKYLRESLLHRPVVAAWGRGLKFERLPSAQVPPPFVMPY